VSIDPIPIPYIYNVSWCQDSSCAYVKWKYWI